MEYAEGVMSNIQQLFFRNMTAATIALLAISKSQATSKVTSKATQARRKNLDGLLANSIGDALYLMDDGPDRKFIVDNLLKARRAFNEDDYPRAAEHTKAASALFDKLLMEGKL